MNEPTMETLTRRLERENRWLKQIGVVALAVTLILVPGRVLTSDVWHSGSCMKGGYLAMLSNRSKQYLEHVECRLEHLELLTTLQETYIETLKFQVQALELQLQDR